MTDPQIIAVALDPRMTPDAVRVALYYAGRGAGEHAYDFDTLSLLLEEAGEKRIRKALKRAETCGYLIRLNGGRGSDRFQFSPPQAAGESVSPPLWAGENVVSPPQAAGEKRPSSTSTDTASSSTTREGDLCFEHLRKFLGTYADVLARFSRSAPHDPDWASDIWHLYRPPGGGNDAGGTEWAAFIGLDEEVAAQVLANALRDYAGKKQVFNARYFRRFVNTARREKERDAKEQLEGTGTDGPKWRGPPGRKKRLFDDPDDYGEGTTEWKGLNG